MHLRETQKDEVRLLKQFLKGIGIYGAEAEIEGFSGYLCELLVLKYDTFLNLLTNVKYRWRQKVVVRLDDTEMPEGFERPLVVIDPVDSSRNAAAAVSEHSIALLIHAAKAYLHSPSDRFFFPAVVKPWPKRKIANELNRRATRLLALKLPKPAIIPDILYPQLRRCQRQLSQQLEQHEFRFIHTNFFLDARTIYIIWELLTDQLPAVKKHYGPFVSHRNAPKFIQKWAEDSRAISAVYITNGRLTVDIRREFSTAAELLEVGIGKLNLGKNLNELVRTRGRIIPHTKISALPAEILTRFFNKEMPWKV
jgi:tRNA nucleotidyltransferase (CCA-adding enzyme)